jgi:hypothetical protein
LRKEGRGRGTGRPGRGERGGEEGGEDFRRKGVGGGFALVPTAENDANDATVRLR